MTYDTIGSIIIMKFSRGISLKKKKETARKLLIEKKNIKTILEKIEKVSGRLRTLKTRFLAGKNTKETIHKESGCFFKLDIGKCYFSPRMSNDRILIAEKIKKNSKVLVLFSGVGPYPIIIAKKTQARKVVGVELNKIASRYARKNIKLNKLNSIEIIQGDVKKVKLKDKFDYVIMTRPQLKDSFLKQGASFLKKNGEIFYHGFGKNIVEIIKELEEEAGKLRKKIKVLEVWKNGDIKPKTYRWTIRFKII